MNIFISLENNLEKNYKLPPNTPLYEAKKQLPTITQSYKYLKEDLVEFINRGFGNKPYKLKNKKFHDKHHAVKQKYINFIRYVKKYRRKLIVRNKLLDELFTGVKGDLEIKIENFFHKGYFYFRDYCDKESGYLFRNTGRIRWRNEWKGYNLAPSHNFYYDDNNQYYKYFSFDQIHEIPIFKIIRRKSQYIEIQNIYTNEIVKILRSHQYKIHTLYFPEEANPDNPTTKLRIDYFLKN